MSRNYFLTGITELLILTILKHQDSYAYEITKIIQQESLELNTDFSCNNLYCNL